MVELAVVPAATVGLLKVQDGDRAIVRERLDRLTKVVTDRLEQRWGGYRVAQMLCEEAYDLSADLEVGNVCVQVDAVEAIEVQKRVPVEHIVDVDHVCHGCHLQLMRPASASRMAARISRQPHLSVVRGWPH